MTERKNVCNPDFAPISIS